MIGVNVAKEVKKPDPAFSGEEDPVEDENENSPLLS